MNDAAPGLRRLLFGDETVWPVAVTIPARDEEDRIVQCLDAVAASLRGRGGVVLVVNGSRDDTFDRAHEWFVATGTRGLLLDEPGLSCRSDVGRARRRAVAACEAWLSPSAAVLTSDADSRVDADWVDANLSELEQADLICGTVVPDAEEFAALPPEFGCRGAIEDEYFALTLAARRLLDPVPHDPELAHLDAPGASLAFPISLYRDVGGFPRHGLSEDRAFAAVAEARGWRVRYSARARVVTSCRLQGRTPGGMAGTLRARIHEADPFVDEVLQPAAQTILRARLRGTLRRQLAGRDGFAAAWADVESRLPQLSSPRMRLSDLRREKPLLAEALARERPQRARQSA